MNIVKSKRSNSKMQKFANRLRRNKDGATAIEFAILGVPFLALLFGIIEISIVFIITTNTEHALSEVSREIRTGEFQGTGGGADEFKEEICKAMSGLGDCSRLRVDVVAAATGKFADLALPESPPACAATPAEIEACQKADPTLPADSYSNTASEEVVIVRVQYVHKLAVPSSLTGLANSTGNTRIINATTAFRNEPF